MFVAVPLFPSKLRQYIIVFIKLMNLNHLVFTHAD